MTAGKEALFQARADAAVAAALVKNWGMTEEQAVAEVRRMRRPVVANGTLFECVDETGEVVARVERRCKVCDRSRWPGWPETPRLVHHSGTEHIQAWDDETTVCGKDATGDDWWWAL